MAPRRRRLPSLALAAITALALPAAAQAPAPPSRPPFTAHGIAEIVDGTSRYTLQSDLARDSQGRLRIERDLPPGASPARIVEIADPIAGFTSAFALDESHPVLRPLPNRGFVPIGWPTGSWPRLFSTTGPNSQQQQDLGTRPQFGLTASGRRQTLVGPDGRTSATEVWIAAGIALETIYSDTAGYSSHFRITSLTLQPPPPTDFQIAATTSAADLRPTPARIKQLFADARASITGLSDLLALDDAREIAVRELRTLPNDTDWRRQARTDAIDAFHRAVRFPVPPADPLAPQDRSAIAEAQSLKREAETEIINALVSAQPARSTQPVRATPDDYNAALALISGADIPHADLYTLVLIFAFRAHDGAAFDPVAIANRSLREDGTFPYATFLDVASSAGSPTHASAFVHQALAAAAAENDRTAAQAAFNFLSDRGDLEASLAERMPVAGR